MTRGIVFVGRNQSFYFSDPNDTDYKRIINERAKAGDTYSVIGRLIDQRFTDFSTNQKARRYLDSLVRK